MNAAPPLAPTPAPTVTIQQLAKAFQAWNHGVRTTPEKFLTADECALMGIDEMSGSQADYFFQLLKDIA